MALQDDQFPLKQLLARLDLINRRLDVLERPTGTQTAGLLSQVQAAVANIGAAVTAYLSSGFSTGGNITATSGYIFTPAGYAFDITYTRRASWLGNDGRIGWASSSAEAKTNIRDADIDPLKILEVAARSFNYRAEIAKRDDPENEQYDPDYHVALEFGAIAEELDALGLWQVVIYEDHQKPVGIHYELLGLLAIEAIKYVWQQQQQLSSDVAAIKERLGL
jgi:hypothetical protein